MQQKFKPKELYRCHKCDNIKYIATEEAPERCKEPFCTGKPAKIEPYLISTKSRHKDEIMTYVVIRLLIGNLEDHLRGVQQFQAIDFREIEKEGIHEMLQELLNNPEKGFQLLNFLNLIEEIEGKKGEVYRFLLKAELKYSVQQEQYPTISRRISEVLQEYQKRQLLKIS